MHRHIAMPQMYNMRDLGGLPTHAGDVTPYNVFWRGDSPHNVSSLARELLLEHQMTTVIDMRQADECAKYPSPFVHDTDIRYVHIPLLAGRGDTLEIIELRDFYVHIVDERAHAIASVLQTCATAPAGVFFHCQLGKDRTGIISALLLLLAGVDEAAIIDDYAATTHHLNALVVKLQSERPSHIPEAAFVELLSAYPATMHYLITHLHARYGGISDYLAHVDLAPVYVNILRNKLRTQA